MDFAELKKNPSQHFETPQAVVDDPSLDRAQKVEILKQWEVDAELLSTAEAENMSGGNPPRIDSVRDAMRSLDA